jgi:hypothetical protein
MQKKCNFILYLLTNSGNNVVLKGSNLNSKPQRFIQDPNKTIRIRLHLFLQVYQDLVHKVINLQVFCDMKRINCVEGRSKCYITLIDMLKNIFCY